MQGNRIFAGWLLSAIVTTCALAQDGSPAANGTAKSSASGATTASSAHRSVRRSQGPDETSAAELAKAETAIEKRDYATAENLLRKLVDAGPVSYVVWFDLGFAENGLGKVDESIAAYRKSVAANPDVFEANLNLGLQLAKGGQPEAEIFLRAATRLKPTSRVAEGHYRAWLSLGRAIEKSKPEEAADAYHRAAALQPNEAEPHLLAGQVFERENKSAEAEREYKQALALDAKSSDAATALANLYMRAKQFPEAEAYLRKLLPEDSDSAAIHIQLGRVLAAEGRNEDAIAELQAGMRLAPGDDAAQRDLAELYSTEEKNDLAEAAFRELVARHPNEAELHRSLGQTLLREKKFPEAQQEFLVAIKLKPDFGAAYGDLAFSASENKDYELVLRALQARAKLLPENALTYFLRASAYDHLHDMKDAAANFHLFLKVADGKYPDYEWQAKHRLIAIEPKK